MAKRSGGTTKSGKFVNPTDRARKAARKKELKKNKKQRTLVRSAVIQQKDPIQVLADFERLDQMEFNVTTGPLLTENVLTTKRRKLKETWDRLLRHYQKEDKDKFIELKRLEGEYELKRSEMKKFYESVKSAEAVNLDEIPLPELPSGDGPSNIQLPPHGSSTVPPSILARKVAPVLSSNRNIVRDKKPPGPPAGPPPDLTDFDDDTDVDDKETIGAKKVRFGDDPVKTTKDKEEDVDEFLKEIEKDLPGVPYPNAPLRVPPPVGVRPPLIPTAAGTSMTPQMMQMIRGGPPPLPSPHVGPPNMRPPGFRPGMGAMIPPPASLTLAHNTPQPKNMKQQQPLPSNNPRVPFMPPNLSNHPGVPPAKHGVMIEAKPQLRNLSADSTRLIPVSLRIKRQPDRPQKKPVAQQMRSGISGFSFTSSDTRQESMQQQPSSSATISKTDDAYDQFMKELNGMI